MAERIEKTVKKLSNVQQMLLNDLIVGVWYCPFDLTKDDLNELKNTKPAPKEVKSFPSWFNSNPWPTLRCLVESGKVILRILKWPEGMKIPIYKRIE